MVWMLLGLVLVVAGLPRRAEATNQQPFTRLTKPIIQVKP
jgi:hypothetical protein